MSKVITDIREKKVLGRIVVQECEWFWGSEQKFILNHTQIKLTVPSLRIKLEKIQDAIAYAIVSCQS